MSSVAEQLRTAREKQKLTVQEVAEITKLKPDHVRALEEGDYNVFAAPVYIRGFTRTYATILKLDVPKIMDDLDAELAQTKKFREPPRLSGTAGGPVDFILFYLSRLNWRIILPLLAILIIGYLGMLGWQAWQRHQAKDPLSELGPGLYRPAQTNVGGYLPLPTNAPAPRR